MFFFHNILFPLCITMYDVCTSRHAVDSGFNAWQSRCFPAFWVSWFGLFRFLPTPWFLSIENSNRRGFSGSGHSIPGFNHVFLLHRSHFGQRQNPNCDIIQKCQLKLEKRRRKHFEKKMEFLSPFQEQTKGGQIKYMRNPEHENRELSEPKL